MTIEHRLDAELEKPTEINRSERGFWSGRTTNSDHHSPVVFWTGLATSSADAEASTRQAARSLNATLSYGGIHTMNDPAPGVVVERWVDQRPFVEVGFPSGVTWPYELVSKDRISKPDDGSSGPGQIRPKRALSGKLLVKYLLSILRTDPEVRRSLFEGQRLTVAHSSQAYPTSCGSRSFTARFYIINEHGRVVLLSDHTSQAALNLLLRACSLGAVFRWSDDGSFFLKLEQQSATLLAAERAAIASGKHSGGMTLAAALDYLRRFGHAKLADSLQVQAKTPL